ncbi:iron-containing redox enzyme family protein [Gynuella sp.]|uniref:iron-containing redox enzyme family protein n=1 Tax=Gynuella sp. TaxID=2969146 RepID=UPI003D147196
MTVKDRFSEKLALLGTFPQFRDNEDWVEEMSVWFRMVRPQTFKHINFEPTRSDNVFNYPAFTMNRILTALNEQDFLFLPEQYDGNIVEQLKSVYSDELRQLSAELIPELERRCLGFLMNELESFGAGWDSRTLFDYFDSAIQDNDELPASLALVREWPDRKELAETLVIQHALDFLPESSHMIRHAKGDYGTLQSALFRIVIDEFGYGNHATKHSSLFKATLASIGLKTHSHAYWSFYLNSTLLMNNYFHYISRRPECFFQYLGAISYAENTFGPYCRQMAGLLREVYGERADVRYYQEHVHIDKHHGRMGVNELLKPAIAQFGDGVVAEMAKGVEMTRRLQQIAEQDLSSQLTWMAQQQNHRDLAHEIKPSVFGDIENLPVMLLDEPYHELSVPHVHDGDEFCVVDQGVLRFCHGFNCYSDLRPGECVVIRKNRLHGALVLSENCNYRILSIGDYARYADHHI